MNEQKKISWKRKCFEWLTKPYTKAFKNAKAWNVSLFEDSELLYQHSLAQGKLYFICPSRKALWRARTLLTKEPGTIAWIDTFQKGETFFDIGANIGVYSLYAAYRGIDCVAFEPESQNYALLNRNIYANSFSDRITALNLALSSTSGIGYLNLRNFRAGSAMHNFGTAVGYDKKEFTPVFRQGVPSMSLDALIGQNGLKVPTHIKIDVDGIEREIINGAAQTLTNPSVKSVQIELNTGLKEDLEIKKILEDYGFSCQSQMYAGRFDEGQAARVVNFTFRR